MTVQDRWQKTERLGTVIDLLATQFTYRDADGRTWFAFYSDDWSYV